MNNDNKDNLEEQEVIEEFNNDSQKDNLNEYSNNNVNNSLEYAYEISKPSETAKHFKELPKEIKHAFLNAKEKKEIEHRARTYNTFMYIKKLLKLQQLEDRNLIIKRRQIYKVTNRDELNNYFRNINRYYLFKELDKLGKIDEIISYIKTVESTGFEDDLININENVISVYTKYNEIKAEYVKPEFVDDAGNLSEMLTIAIATSGEDGNERYAGITSISATREMDIIGDKKKDTEYKPSLFQKFRRKFS